ncbi:MAG: DNA translocase FtsK 4TM domain-containing protein, partial [Mariprofundales bacterium]
MKIKREPWAIVSGGLAIIIGWSLYGFSPTDPSFNNAPAAVAEIANPIGIMGAYIADILLQLFGYAAWLLPLLMLVFTWRLLRGIEPANGGWNSIFWVFVGLCIAALSHAHLDAGNFPAGNGGAGGSIIASALSMLAGDIGRDLLLIILLLSSVITAGQTSVINAIVFSLTIASNAIELLIAKYKKDSPSSYEEQHEQHENKHEHTVDSENKDNINIKQEPIFTEDDNSTTPPTPTANITESEVLDQDSKEAKKTDAKDDNMDFDDWDDLNVPSTEPEKKEVEETESLDTLGFGDGAQGKDGGIRWVSEQQKQREDAEILHNSESSNVRWRTMTGANSTIGNFVVANTGSFANTAATQEQVETHTDFQTVPIPDMDEDEVRDENNHDNVSLNQFDIDVDTTGIDDEQNHDEQNHDEQHIQDRNIPTIPDISPHDQSIEIPPIPNQERSSSLDTQLLWDEHQDEDED